MFDNVTGVGKRDWVRRVTTTRLFELFKLHYRVEARFTSPGSGNEKGSVENAVGYIRRNFLVRLPHVESLPALTTVLLSACDGLLATTHYRKHDTIGAWFQDDRQAMLPLPGIGFDACTWPSRRVDLVGNLQINEVKYHVGNEYAGQ
ncbi:transposase [Leucobacter coleopterorum]|uniref:Transposase n=1 Tax=Leucobacter coleopterorum TaxID=2714933 RepID=A0ABX6K1H9_9MICO|nr:transposase [Leucobacter coleopterorum]QIM19039.1 transposase [Leucobacter coleopterorum]